VEGWPCDPCRHWQGRHASQKLVADLSGRQNSNYRLATISDAGRLDQALLERFAAKARIPDVGSELKEMG